VLLVKSNTLYCGKDIRKRKLHGNLMKTSNLRRTMAGKRPSSYARRELGSSRLRLAKQNGSHQPGKVTGTPKEAQKSIKNLFMLAAKEWLSCWPSKCQISFYSLD
jgi:hypothetical protein